MTTRFMRVALAVTVFFLMTGASFAQGPWRGQRDRDDRQHQSNAQKSSNRVARDGRADREHGGAWHPNNGQNRNDRYRGNYGGYGYPNGTYYPYGGYGNYGGYGYPNGTYGPYGGYGNYGGYNAQSLDYNNGYQTGLNYGAADRNNGHSYRPTYSSTYKHGTYAFQQGFLTGYQRGYNGGGYRRY